MLTGVLSGFCCRYALAKFWPQQQDFSPNQCSSEVRCCWKHGGDAFLIYFGQFSMPSAHRSTASVSLIFLCLLVTMRWRRNVCYHHCVLRTLVLLNPCQVNIEVRWFCLQRDITNCSLLQRTTNLLGKLGDLSTFLLSQEGCVLLPSCPIWTVLMMSKTLHYQSLSCPPMPFPERGVFFYSFQQTA